MKNFIALFLISCLSLLPLSAIAKADGNNAYAKKIYRSLQGHQKPEFSLFQKALLGYVDLLLDNTFEHNQNILSIIDFRMASDQKRMWVIDLEKKLILYHTYVAHGKKSGKTYATNFSNKINSNQSSLGYYKTRQTYIGKNGLSLRLEGLEVGINDNALRRYIVLHGADYASEQYLKKEGSLGTSEGCPAVPLGIHKAIIETTKNGSCLFIYFPDLSYSQESRYFKTVDN